jgi:ferrous iron transport protein A
MLPATAWMAAETQKEGKCMMPLVFASAGDENIIRKIGGSPEVKKHLENLGFVVGGKVSVITQTGGNVIVNVKEARVAISSEMAQKIMV